MCPHFDNYAKQCKLHTSSSWASEVNSFGYDFITNDYCLASKNSSDSGADNTGYANCGMYKSNE